MKTQKDNSMDIFLGIAILLAAAGLFYMKAFRTPKIEEPKNDPIVELTEKIEKIEKQNKLLTEALDNVKEYRQKNEARHEEIETQIKDLRDDVLETRKEYNTLYEKFKIANTTLLRLQASQFRGPSEMKVKFDGPILFELKKPVIEPAPTKTPPVKGKGAKSLFTQASEN